MTFLEGEKLSKTIGNEHMFYNKPEANNCRPNYLPPHFCGIHVGRIWKCANKYYESKRLPKRLNNIYCKNIRMIRILVLNIKPPSACNCDTEFILPSFNENVAKLSGAPS